MEVLGGSNMGANDLVVPHLKTLNFGLRAKIDDLDDILGGRVRYFPIAVIEALRAAGDVQGFTPFCMNPLETQIHKRFLEVRTKHNVLSFQPSGLPTLGDGEEGTTVNPYVYPAHGDETVNHLGEMLMVFSSWELVVEVASFPV